MGESRTKSFASLMVKSVSAGFLMRALQAASMVCKLCNVSCAVETAYSGRRAMSFAFRVTLGFGVSDGVAWRERRSRLEGDGYPEMDRRVRLDKVVVPIERQSRRGRRATRSLLKSGTVAR